MYKVYQDILKKKVVENDTSKGLTALGNILRIKKTYYLSSDSIIRQAVIR